MKRYIITVVLTVAVGGCAQTPARQATPGNPSAARYNLEDG
jgi:hypothetical protein